MNYENAKQQKSSKLEIWNVSKEDLALNWYDLQDEEKKRNFKQGQIVYCEIGENIGYEICNTRPSLIVSDDRYSKNGTLSVIPLTKNVAKKMKTHYTLLKTKYDFLAFDSCVKTEQIRVISSNRVTGLLGSIMDEDLDKVKIRIKTLFKL